MNWLINIPILIGDSIAQYSARSGISVHLVEKHTLKLSVFRLFAFLIVGGCLFADDLQWGGTYLAAWSGFGTSPYTAIDTSDNNKLLTIFCLDFNDEIAPPINWTANIRPLTASNVSNFAQFGGNYGTGIPGAPFGITAPAFQSDLAPGNPHYISLADSSAAYTRYLEASWLFGNILQSLPHGDVNTSVISQVAAWDLFVEERNQSALAGDISASNASGSIYTFNNYLYSANSYSTSPTTDSLGGLNFEEAVDEALKAAQNAVLNENWAGSKYIGSWNLVTGDPAWTATAANGIPVQEFLTDAPPAVPEPGTVFLLGTMVAAIGLARRCRRASTRRLP